MIHSGLCCHTQPFPRCQALLCIRACFLLWDQGEFSNPLLPMQRRKSCPVLPAVLTVLLPLRSVCLHFKEAEYLASNEGRAVRKAKEQGEVKSLGTLSSAFNTVPTA